MVKVEITQKKLKSLMHMVFQACREAPFSMSSSVSITTFSFSSKSGRGGVFLSATL